MVFITKLFESRLNDNFSRHRLDAKIAPSRPKPSCRPVFNNSESAPAYCEKPEAVKNVLKVVEPTGTFTSTRQNEVFEQQAATTSIGRQSSPLTIGDAEKKPILAGDMGFKPLARSGSDESGIFTASGSDVASGDVSFPA